MTPEQHYQEAERLLVRAEGIVHASTGACEVVTRIARAHTYLADVGHRCGFAATADIQDD
jgi:hypothetical protein